MADPRSQDTVESQNVVVVITPQVDVSLTDASEEFDTLTRSYEEIASKVDSHHRLTLDLSNYYFAFIGILLATVSGSSYFNCRTAWFLSLLCGVGAIPAITTLAFLAHGWLNMTAKLDALLRALGKFQPPMTEELSRRFLPLDHERVSILPVLKNRYSIVIGRNYSRGVRCLIVIAGGILIVVFTVAVATLPRHFICSNAAATGAPDFWATSEQAFEKHVNNHLEGIPFYGSRGELMGPESSYRFSGNKRSNSESFMVSSRDKLPQGQPDSQDNPVLTKLMRYSGGEQPRQPHDEETFGAHQLRPIPSAFISQSSHGGRTGANNPKWDRAITGNLGPGSQYPPRSGQVSPFGYQALSSKIRDTNVGTSVVSQTAADEGSRTGIKGSGILSSINTVGGISGRQPSGVLIRRELQGRSSDKEDAYRGFSSGNEEMLEEG